ncbi:hypothetical protein L226DRAFT_556366 [Lentinus tigrinus ALCF2SS1-7]|uniref:uncharacterized protein n=1 Tax=Lentinus tigrinus ALCF2SS1-7 TaxID=1328758 RepID=UPI0011660049|nr:hypothetical protein L226DRAFT_556366 [Lentinus tigrinus ALCF2SS1-7]
MPSLLSSTLAQTSRSQHCLLLQSSTAQSCLPVLRALVKRASERTRETTVLFCFLYPPSSFLDSSRTQAHHIRIVNRTSNVPGYEDAFETQKDWIAALKSEILETVRSAPQGPLNVVIDSADTLLSDIGSLAETTHLLSEVFGVVHSRGGSSRLIIHVLAPCPLIPILTQTRFSSSLTHITAHPPALLTHLSSAYLTPPPPLSPPEKFWGVFIPISERHYESEKLVFGQNGEGSGPQEFVVEVLVRGGADGSGRRRGIERVLEGWSSAVGGPCDLRDLESLRTLWAKKLVYETQAAVDPTQNLSFNLNLTPEQQRSRAQVPLPYAHEGKPAETTRTPAAILYDPDSADDLDDDDPDEDLDI